MVSAESVAKLPGPLIELVFLERLVCVRETRRSFAIKVVIW